MSRHEPDSDDTLHGQHDNPSSYLLWCSFWRKLLFPLFFFTDCAPSVIARCISESFFIRSSFPHDGVTPMPFYVPSVCRCLEPPSTSPRLYHELSRPDIQHLATRCPWTFLQIKISRFPHPPVHILKSSPPARTYITIYNQLTSLFPFASVSRRAFVFQLALLVLLILIFCLISATCVLTRLPVYDLPGCLAILNFLTCLDRLQVC